MPEYFDTIEDVGGQGMHQFVIKGDEEDAQLMQAHYKVRIHT